MIFDISTVIAGGATAILSFLLIRGFMLWRKYNNTQKANDEIKMDKMISDAIKAGDTELIAKIRKYFLHYRKDKK
jgi:hypothetical protein